VRRNTSLICLVWALGVALAPVAASTSIYMTPEALAERATVVVEGQVTRIASGPDANGLRVATYIDLDIDQVHRGPADLTGLTVREAGGVAGDLVLEIDAAPHYTVGERVFVFLEAADDGALRTVGMFYGKYSLAGSDSDDVEPARRDLADRGRIFRAPLRDGDDDVAPVEEIDKRSLVSLTASMATPRHQRQGRLESAASTDNWRPRPVEYDAIDWQRIEEWQPTPATDRGFASDLTTYELDDQDLRPRFVALSSSNPARWVQSDSGSAVVIDVDPTGNPLGNDAQATAEMVRAFDAWNDVPESRLLLSLGNGNDNFVATHAQSPAAAYPDRSVILFDDPYNDISNPSGCSGVLAIGGYWRTTSMAGMVNGVNFHPVLRLYVIFNNNFSCFLGDADNLAEVAAHELGHGIGLGHSWVFDALMRSSAYGGRGPRLGDDDLDAAHCHYPHAVGMVTPNGGEQLTVGETYGIQWSASAESSGDPGSVRLQLSTDGGQAWSTIADGTANDGWYDWTVPDTPGTDMRVRVVRPARMGANPSLYDEFCSDDVSNSSFEIVAASPTEPGDIDLGSLRLEPSGFGDVRVSWEAGCSTSISGYTVYEGSLATLRGGQYQVTAAVCDAGLDLEEVLTPSGADRFYLVVPHDASREGGLGVDSDGTLRPAPSSPCRASTTGSSCS